MIIAELNGKLPSNIETKEDILTSNVFSFFKYSNRNLLKEYLKALGINVSLQDAHDAEFLFWQCYEDNTEPDIVIICGEYYILFEAKLYSDFSPKTDKIECQIVREIQMGKQFAENINKKFVYVAITAEYFMRKEKYFKYESKDYIFIWTNWQKISFFLENKLLDDSIHTDKYFAEDLYALLIKKRLRSYKGMVHLQTNNLKIPQTPLFYNLNTSKFKGIFTGFVENLKDLPTVKTLQWNFKKSYFRNLKTFELTSNETIFYHGNQ